MEGYTADEIRAMAFVGPLATCVAGAVQLHATYFKDDVRYPLQAFAFVDRWRNVCVDAQGPYPSYLLECLSSPKAREDTTIRRAYPEGLAVVKKCAEDAYMLHPHSPKDALNAFATECLSQAEAQAENGGEFVSNFLEGIKMVFNSRMGGN